jgi:hypothetical protein
VNRWWAGLALVGATVVWGAGPADAQLIPTTTTTAPTETTVTTLPATTTTATTAASTTTTAAATTTTAGAPASTAPPSTATTTPTSLPPEGVSSTTAPPAPDEVLEADTGKLPLFVSLSLGGFAVAIAIMAVQWVRTRPTRAEAG